MRVVHVSGWMAYLVLAVLGAAYVEPVAAACNISHTGNGNGNARYHLRLGRINTHLTEVILRIDPDPPNTNGSFRIGATPPGEYVGSQNTIATDQVINSVTANSNKLWTFVQAQPIKNFVKRNRINNWGRTAINTAHKLDTASCVSALCIGQSIPSSHFSWSVVPRNGAIFDAGKETGSFVNGGGLIEVSSIPIPPHENQYQPSNYLNAKLSIEYANTLLLPPGVYEGALTYRTKVVGP